MLVFHDNDWWETDDISRRIASELKDSNPTKKIHLVRDRDGFEKNVELREIDFPAEHRC